MASLAKQLNISSADAARRLLGSYIERDFDGETALVKIVETEAYDSSDEASHSYSGETSRNAALFGPAGHLYVYFTYGMHFCCNIVTGEIGHGAGVLIRAVEPISGTKRLLRNRPVKKATELTNGPAKLAQALQLDRSWNHHNMENPPLRLIIQPALQRDEIEQTTRIGIRKAVDLPWRFSVRDSQYVSKSVTNITKRQNLKRYS